jgi:hypothetical protein
VPPPPSFGSLCRYPNGDYVDIKAFTHPRAGSMLDNYRVMNDPKWRAVFHGLEDKVQSDTKADRKPSSVSTSGPTGGGAGTSKATAARPDTKPASEPAHADRVCLDNAGRTSAKPARAEERAITATFERTQLELNVDQADSALFEATVRWAGSGLARHFWFAFVLDLRMRTRMHRHSTPLGLETASSHFTL